MQLYILRTECSRQHRLGNTIPQMPLLVVHTYGISFYFSSFHFPLRNTQKDLRETAKTTKIDTSRTRTDASEESRFLIYRLRPLGHSVLMVHEVDKLIS